MIEPGLSCSLISIRNIILTQGNRMINDTYLNWQNSWPCRRRWESWCRALRWARGCGLIEGPRGKAAPHESTRHAGGCSTLSWSALEPWHRSSCPRPAAAAAAPSPPPPPPPRPWRCTGRAWRAARRTPASRERRASAGGASPGWRGSLSGSPCARDCATSCK